MRNKQRVMLALQRHRFLIPSILLLLPATIHGFFVHDSFSTLYQQAPTKRGSLTLYLAASKQQQQHPSGAKPIDPSGWPDRFPAQEHCSKCGLCDTSFVSQVKDACAFLDDGMSRMDSAELRVHGRQRDLATMQWPTSSTRNKDKDTGMAEEARFGVLHEPMRLAKGKRVENAQWTGVVTGIALSMLESEMVDAVVCIASLEEQQQDNTGSGGGDNNIQQQWSYPEPILARTSEEVLRGRGVKPALAPSLRVLDEIRQDSSIKKLLFCGVGCAVQAFRAIQDDLHLEEVYVMGTNCVDNSPTPEAAQRFLRDGVGIESTEQVRGYEFMQDFRVHVKTSNGYKTRPYFSLPGTIAAPSIATSCLACFDYTNGLADVVVGYMGAPLDSNQRMDESFQTLSIRNALGSKMVEAAVNANRLQVSETALGNGSHESLASATVAADGIVQSLVGGKVPEKGMPLVLGEIMAFAMRNVVGPKGVNFARYSIDYHILRNYLHVLHEWGDERAHQTMPQYARDIVDHYLNSSDGTMAKLKAQIQNGTKAKQNR